MSKRVRISAIILSLTVLAATAFAQQNSLNYQSFQPYGKQAPFTSSELTRFMADWPSVVTWGNQHHEDFSGAKNASDLAGLFAAADFQAFITSKGWTVNRFGYVAAEVALCLGAIEMKAQMPEADSQMQAAIDQIKNNPNMSAEQKTAAIQMMQGTQGQIFEMFKHVPQSEIDLVTPKQEELKTMFEQTN